MLGKSGRVHSGEAGIREGYVDGRDYPETEEELFGILKLPFRPASDRCA